MASGEALNLIYVLIAFATVALSGYFLTPSKHPDAVYVIYYYSSFLIIAIISVIRTSVVLACVCLYITFVF